MCTGLRKWAEQILYLGEEPYLRVEGGWEKKEARLHFLRTSKPGMFMKCPSLLWAAFLWGGQEVRRWSLPQIKKF